MEAEKASLRRRCHQIRGGMSPEKVGMSSGAVCGHLSNWPIFQRANTVLGFLAFRNEIDLSQLFERWPDKRWLAPRVVEDTGEKPYLALHLYNPTRLVRHRFGMLEPDPALPTVHAVEVEVVLVPGVAFDRRGGRLGFGGGFYDRLLPLASRATCIGVTYDELVLDALPMQPWDCRVGWLVTPGGIWDTDDTDKHRSRGAACQGPGGAGLPARPTGLRRSRDIIANAPQPNRQMPPVTT
jgi:5-formyltetrahydrofolate cyclo-ligase